MQGIIGLNDWSLRMFDDDNLDVLTIGVGKV